MPCKTDLSVPPISDVYATSTEAEQAVAKVAMSKIERKKASGNMLA